MDHEFKICEEFGCPSTGRGLLQKLPIKCTKLYLVFSRKLFMELSLGVIPTDFIFLNCSRLRDWVGSSAIVLVALPLC